MENRASEELTMATRNDRSTLPCIDGSTLSVEALVRVGDVDDGLRGCPAQCFEMKSALEMAVIETAVVVRRH